MSIDGLNAAVDSLKDCLDETGFIKENSLPSCLERYIKEQKSVIDSNFELNRLQEYEQEIINKYTERAIRISYSAGMLTSFFSGKIGISHGENISSFLEKNYRLFEDEGVENIVMSDAYHEAISPIQFLDTADDYDGYNYISVWLSEEMEQMIGEIAYSCGIDDAVWEYQEDTPYDSCLDDELQYGSISSGTEDQGHNAGILSFLLPEYIENIFNFYFFVGRAVGETDILSLERLSLPKDFYL